MDAAPPDPADPADPVTAVRLHLHRGFGWGLYGSLTAVVAVVAVLSTVRYLIAGEIIFAGLAALGGVVVGGLLGVLTYATVWPELTASAIGMRARMCWAPQIEAGWNEIVIDVDDEAERGTLRLDLGQQGQEPVSINAQTWIGFDKFVVLVGSSAVAAARLTPEARREVLRMFGATE